ncbi:hypothetical protein PDESU_02791 [Pontiella desulfatans]|uniref:Uncharacterized protein n=1 Tax=Pontiella desulfatans TaxID=2750659 RepID=A0A6C2U2L4_PONDE|nr:hypothetical protein PDESU_02791 [Pontiella desulfatans]
MRSVVACVVIILGAMSYHRIVDLLSNPRSLMQRTYEMTL